MLCIGGVRESIVSTYGRRYLRAVANFSPPLKADTARKFFLHGTLAKKDLVVAVFAVPTHENKRSPPPNPPSRPASGR
jgi:hypothetical protein